MRQQLLVPAGVRVLLFNRLSRTQSLPTSARLPLPGAAYPIFMPAGERSAHDYCSGRTSVEQESEELQRSLRVHLPFRTPLARTHPPLASADRTRVGVRHAAVLARLRPCGPPAGCHPQEQSYLTCHAGYGQRHSCGTPRRYAPYKVAPITPSRPHAHTPIARMILGPPESPLVKPYEKVTSLMSMETISMSVIGRRSGPRV
jgi:hypothetical protein